jgi:hypothetical protein
MDSSEARQVLLAATEHGGVKLSEVKRFADFRKLKWEAIWPTN